MKTITELLDELGETPDKVAAKLQELGIVGTPGCRASCPVAVYLKLNGFGLAEVASTWACTYQASNWICVDLPLAVRQFVRLMDMGKWPELKAKVAPCQ